MISCILMALARAAIGYAIPVDSGIGPLHTFARLPIYLLLSALVALAVLTFARAWKLPAISAPQHAVVGAACGLTSSLQLATPWAPELPALLVTVGITLGIAVFLRSHMGARGGT